MLEWSFTLLDNVMHVWGMLAYSSFLPSQNKSITQNIMNTLHIKHTFVLSSRYGRNMKVDWLNFYSAKSYNSMLLKQRFIWGVKNPFCTKFIKAIHSNSAIILKHLHLYKSH